MAFNKTIADVQASGVRINFTNNNAQLADMYAADQEFLIPVLGDALFATITAANPDAIYAQLILLCKRAEAALAYWLDLPNIQTQIGDRGLYTTDTTNGSAAHRWEYNEVRESLAEKGCKAQEFLLQYLYNNATTIGWTEPATYKSIFRTGKEFSECYTLFQPYRTFENLRSIIKNVERKYIRPVIGDAFFESLRDYSGSDDNMLAARDMVKNAVANLSIYKACLSLPVKFSAGGFTVLLADNSDAVNQGEQNAPAHELNAMADDAERDGNGYIQVLKSFLNNTASSLVFEDYYTSAYYVPPLLIAVDTPNANRAIFGF